MSGKTAKKSSTVSKTKRKPSTSSAPAKKRKAALRERVIEARAGEEIRCVKLRVKRGERLVLVGAVHVDSVVVAQGGVLRYSESGGGCAPKKIENHGTIEQVGGK